MFRTRFHLLLLVTLSLTIGTALAADKPPLTKELINRFFATFEEIEALGIEDPIDSEKEDNFWYIADDGKLLAEHLRSAPLAGKIKKIAKSHGFSSLEELTSVLSRFSSAAIAVQLEKNPGMKPSKQQLEEAKKAQAQMREQMLAAGMPEAMIDNQIKEIDKMNSMWGQLENIGKKADPKDVKFARQNMDYLEKLMPDDEEEQMPGMME